MSSATFPPALGGDGTTVTDDANPVTGLANGGHHTRFVPALAQTVAMAQTSVTQAGNAATSAAAAAASAAAAQAAPGSASSSTTSIAIGTGAKSLTIQAGKTIVVGMPVQIARTSDPANSYMHGIVTSYTSGSGALAVTVDYAFGSGTFTDWTISLTAPIDATRAPTNNPAFTGNASVAGNVTVGGDVTLTAGMLIEAEGAAVLAASTTNIWVTDGNTVHISGTTTINSFGTAPQAGAWMKVIFDGALTLTQGANLNLNGGGANIAVAADDVAFVYADTTTQFDVIVMRKSGLGAVLQSVGDHAVVVNTGNGFGSTNNVIRRFTTTQTNVGTAITYADSATLGASFTINENGLYEIAYSDRGNSPAFFNYGASLNASGTVAVSGLTPAQRLSFANTDYSSTVTRVVKLTAGDVIRPHGEGTVNSINASPLTQFSIRKVGI